MQREYFCCGCGLFHWLDQYKTCEETGRIDRVSYEKCPNDKCISHEETDIAVFPVDTMGYAYYAKIHSEYINKVKWSSPKFAPEMAIEIYKKQDFRIED